MAANREVGKFLPRGAGNNYRAGGSFSYPGFGGAESGARTMLPRY
jgi:hypothetical protein